MTGIMLINSMLTNFQTQKTLLDSDVNKKNIHDLITYLQRVKVYFYFYKDILGKIFTILRPVRECIQMRTQMIEAKFLPLHGDQW